MDVEHAPGRPTVPGSQDRSGDSLWVDRALSSISPQRHLVEGRGGREEHARQDAAVRKNEIADVLALRSKEMKTCLG